MKTDKPEFNLLREPWIVVMKEDGTTEEVGLLELFAQAHQYRGLAGELPTQDIAVLRLLLAILHCVYGKFDPRGDFAPLYDDGSTSVTPQDAFRRWQVIWEDGAFSHPILTQYLEHYEDRFWLFHPERPFYQVPDLNKATDYTAAKLNGELAESGNKIRLFSSRSGAKKGYLTFAEAARWLLHLISFDDASVKKSIKGMKMLSPGVGWLGKIGSVVAVGNNLFEMLMLNLTLLRDGQVLWEPGDAIWELDEVRREERCQIAQPRNPAELLTLQSRRILLKKKDNMVIGYSLLGGDFFPQENAFVEQMTVWRKSPMKKNAPEEYKPRQHDPSRQVWRDFAALFVNNDEYHAPGVVSWVKQLKYQRIVDRPLFRFQIAAVKYDTSNSSYTDIFSDGIAFHGDILNDNMEEQWIGRILQELETTELLVKQVSILKQDIAKAEGESDSNRLRRIANEVCEQAYFRLDRPFRQWLEGINPLADEPHDVSVRWWKQAQHIIHQLGREIVEQCHPRTYAERVVRSNEKEFRYSVPQAYNQFRYRTSSPDALRGGKRHESIKSRSTS